MAAETDPDDPASLEGSHACLQQPPVLRLDIEPAFASSSSHQHASHDQLCCDKYCNPPERRGQLSAGVDRRPVRFRSNQGSLLAAFLVCRGRGSLMVTVTGLVCIDNGLVLHRSEADLESDSPPAVLAEATGQRHEREPTEFVPVLCGHRALGDAQL